MHLNIENLRAKDFFNFDTLYNNIVTMIATNSLKLLLKEKYLEKYMKFTYTPIEPSQIHPSSILFNSVTEMNSVIAHIYNNKDQLVNFYTKNLNLSFAKFLKKTKDAFLQKKITSKVDLIKNYWLTFFASLHKTVQPIQCKSYDSKLDQHYFICGYKIAKNSIDISMPYISKSEKKKIGFKKTVEQEEKSFELLDFLFTAYYRKKNIDLIQDTNLGLLIAKKTVHKIKGKVVVRNTISVAPFFIVKTPKTKHHV